MFITYYFLCCIVLIVATLVAFLSGSVTFGITASLDRQNKIGISVLAGIGGFFLVIFGVLGYWEYRANDYENYGGDFDYYRVPLDYPYELSMIDDVDCASLTIWKNDDHSILTGITHYHKRENIMVGKISAACFLADKSTWFSFDTVTGVAVEYETKEDYLQALEELGFMEEPALLTIQDN